MKFEVKEPNVFKDGNHEGVIVGVEYREKPYEYTDLIIESEEKKIKYGVASFVSPMSKLGKLLVEFGANLEIGKEVDPEKFFVGKKVTFMTMTQKGFANVVKDSVKPK